MISTKFRVSYKIFSLIIFAATLLHSQDLFAGRSSRLKDVRHDIIGVKKSIRKTEKRLEKAEDRGKTSKITAYTKSLDHKEDKLDKLRKKRDHIKGRD